MKTLIFPYFSLISYPCKKGKVVLEQAGLNQKPILNRWQTKKAWLSFSPISLDFPDPEPPQNCHVRQCGVTYTAECIPRRMGITESPCLFQFLQHFSSTNSFIISEQPSFLNFFLFLPLTSQFASTKYLLIIMSLFQLVQQPLPERCAGLGAKSSSQ